MEINNKKIKIIFGVVVIVALAFYFFKYYEVKQSFQDKPVAFNELEDGREIFIRASVDSFNSENLSLRFKPFLFDVVSEEVSPVEVFLNEKTYIYSKNNNIITEENNKSLVEGGVILIFTTVKNWKESDINNKLLVDKIEIE